MWLPRLFRRPRDAGRLIFTFSDGVNRSRRVDPQAVWSALDAACGGEWTDTLKVMATQPPPGCVGEVRAALQRTKEDAGKRLTDAIGAAFELPPFKDGGLTVWERIGLARDFLDYMAALRALARGKGTASPAESPSPAT